MTNLVVLVHRSPANSLRSLSLCDNQCLSFVGVLLGKALKTMFLENYPYPSSFHTETRRAISLFRQFSQS
ncbi:MAG: hypothetical protein EWV73_06310 [Microcystis wesenbergii Mw_QC_B_20070930_S4D]|nr:MAG: hypothetical protein EWV73_06310 [Microcystis wesenbergii Mw_QC_B_20070930_S4D]